MGKLPLELRKLILDGTYNLSLAEKIASLWALKTEERKQWVRNQFLQGNEKQPVTDAMVANGCLQALLEGLLTIENFKGRDTLFIKTIISDNARQALREGLLKASDFKEEDSLSVEAMTSNNALQALRERLFRASDFKGKFYSIIEAMTSDGALQALRVKRNSNASMAMFQPASAADSSMPDKSDEHPATAASCSPSPTKRSG